MTFILTHVEKTAEQREQEKRTIPLSPGGDPSGSHSVESFANGWLEIISLHLSMDV